MSEENLGAGQYLDEDLDFEVGPTGDIRTTSGVEELQKDLAFQMIISLSQFLGEPPTPETESEIKRMAYRVAFADLRVTGVDRNNIIVEWNHRSDAMEVTVPLTTDTGEEQELVFEV